MSSIEHENEGAVSAGGNPPSFDQPLSWSVPLLRLGSTILRVHAFLLAVIVVVLVRAAWNANHESFALGPWLAGIFLASLLVVVTIHELVTLLVTRRLGGDLPEIVLQPLGGLEDGIPPRNWRRCVVMALAGPLSATCISVLALIILAIFSNDSAVTHLWSSSPLYAPQLASSAWLEATFVLGRVALVVAAANLLPVPPFRGRLLMQSMLRPQVGNRSATIITRRIGIVIAILLFVVGVLGRWLELVLVAAMCGAAIQRRARQDRISQALDEAALVEDAMPALEPFGQPSEYEDLVELTTDPQIEASRASSGEEDDLDRILRKISTSGIESLDADERRLLDQATRRRRDEP